MVKASAECSQNFKIPGALIDGRVGFAAGFLYLSQRNGGATADLNLSTGSRMS